MGKVGNIVPLEIVVGSNGYVWIKTKKLLTTTLIGLLLLSASALPAEHHNAIIRAFRESVTGWV